MAETTTPRATLLRCRCGHAADPWHKPASQRSPVRRCLGDERADGHCECRRSREQVVADARSAP